MKLIGNFEDVESADYMAELLLAQGIITHVSSRETKSLGTAASGFIKPGLWTVLEHQHEDAINFLNDNTHIVTTGLSQEEIIEFNTVAKANAFESLNKALMWGILLIVAMSYTVYKMASS